MDENAKGWGGQGTQMGPHHVRVLSRRFALQAGAVWVVLAALAGCGGRRVSRRPPATPPSVVQGEKGIASWYGGKFHGRRTANGEIYNMYEMTAAHKTLPFGTRVRVHHLAKKRHVTVRINDRGPFVKGRIIDLSYSAAQAIDLDRDGIAPVRLQILNFPVAGAGLYSVQVGAFGNREKAYEIKKRLSARFFPIFIQPRKRGRKTFYRVRVGRVGSLAQARKLERRLRKANHKTFIVNLDWTQKTRRFQRKIGKE